MGIIWRDGRGLGGCVCGWLSLRLLSHVELQLKSTIDVILQRKDQLMPPPTHYFTTCIAKIYTPYCLIFLVSVQVGLSSM